jgi:hypothetical protein
MKCTIEIEMIAYFADQPGFAKCRFQDANGTEKIIMEKIPVLTIDFIDETTALPLTILLHGSVNIKGFETKEIVTFKTDHYVEDIDGNSDFLIFKTDLRI